jgi:imidazolonepropionase-like amidohydrolase
MTTTKIALSIFMLMLSIKVSAYYNEPAPEQDLPVCLYGATIHTGTGEVIENGVLAFDGGIIIYAGKKDEFELDTSGWDVRYLEGKHLYPGLIALNTRLGLVEIDQARPTRDFNETGDFNPNVRSLIAYNTDSRILPTIRTNGILLAQTTPSGGRISGTSSVVNLDAWNWEDAAYLSDNAIHLNWPSLFRSTGWWAAPGPIVKQDISEDVEEVFLFFEQAYAYHIAGNHRHVNLKLEAMRGLFTQQKKLFVNVDYVKGIREAIRLAETYDIKIVIVGGHDAHYIASELAEKDIPVVLDRTHRLPNRAGEAADIAYQLPAKLIDAGVTVAISRNASWDVRNLPFYAGSAAAHGLSAEVALQTISLNAAKILGIDNRVGSLESGKDAFILVSAGDMLDMLGNKIEFAFINGREIDLNNHQSRLYEKYMRKYKLDNE